MKALLLAATLCALLISCRSVNVNEVLDDAGSLEIIQLAQTELDAGNTEGALAYYELLLRRFGTNLSVYVEGRFEIGHIYYKEQDFDRAEPILEEVVEIYAASEAGELPGAFRKLAQNDLDKLREERDAMREPNGGRAIPGIHFAGDVEYASALSRASLSFGENGAVRGRVYSDVIFQGTYALTRSRTEGYIRRSMQSPYPEYKFTVMGGGTGIRLFRLESGSYIDTLVVRSPTSSGAPSASGGY